MNGWGVWHPRFGFIYSISLEQTRISANPLEPYGNHVIAFVIASSGIILIT
jgi:hypothetical protein